jgi:hypothetical protein
MYALDEAQKVVCFLLLSCLSILFLVSSPVSFDRLSELEDLPILLTHGQYDTMRPAVVHTMYDAIPLAEKYLLKKSGHVSMIDEPLEMNNAIADFLNRVEAARSSEARFSPRIEWKSKREKMQTWTLIIAVLVVFVASLVFGRRQSSSSRGQYSTV